VQKSSPSTSPCAEIRARCKAAPCPPPPNGHWPGPPRPRPPQTTPRVPRKPTRRHRRKRRPPRPPKGTWRRRRRWRVLTRQRPTDGGQWTPSRTTSPTAPSTTFSTHTVNIFHLISHHFLVVLLRVFSCNVEVADVLSLPCIRSSPSIQMDCCLLLTAPCGL